MREAKGLKTGLGQPEARRGQKSEGLSVLMSGVESAKLAGYAVSLGKTPNALLRAWIDAYVADPEAHWARIKMLGPSVADAGAEKRKCVVISAGVQRRIAFKQAAEQVGAQPSKLIRAWISHCPAPSSADAPASLRLPTAKAGAATPSGTTISARFDSAVVAAFNSLCLAHQIHRADAVAAWMEYLATPGRAHAAVAALSSLDCEAIRSGIGAAADGTGDGRARRVKGSITNLAFPIDADLNERASTAIASRGMTAHVALFRLMLLALASRSIDIERMLRVEAGNVALARRPGEAASRAVGSSFD